MKNLSLSPKNQKPDRNSFVKEILKDVQPEENMTSMEDSVMDGRAELESKILDEQVRTTYMGKYYSKPSIITPKEDMTSDNAAAKMPASPTMSRSPSFVSRMPQQNVGTAIKKFAFNDAAIQ